MVRNVLLPLFTLAASAVGAIQVLVKDCKDSSVILLVGQYRYWSKIVRIAV
jgi:hypothetical protein